MIDEVDNLKILGFHFDQKLTRSTMVDSMSSTRCWQRMGALYCVRDFLGLKGFIVAYKSFVRPV